MALSKAKTELVARIFASAPNDAMHRLELVLDRARADDPALDPVHVLAAAECQCRRVVAEVFEPFIPMTEAGAPPKRATLSRRKLSGAWQAVLAADPALGEQASIAAAARRSGDGAAPTLDAACLKAAELIEADDLALADLLRLAPVLRQVQAKLPSWTYNLSGEAVASVRLAFKDALEISEGVGPVFWEAVLAMLDEPWRVIRLISAAIDRPSDRYLADSELRGLCERLLDDVDDRIGSLKRFDPDRGEIGGVTQAASVLIATQIVGEFEAWLALNKHGPWGQRIAEQKKALALTMESLLRATEPAVAAALPVQRSLGRAIRPAPKLSADPQPLLVNRAEAFLTLMEEARSAASSGGFASLRTKTIESLDLRLEQYCEDLIEALRHEDQDEPERVRAYLEIGAKFSGLVKGPQSAQIIRRRAAAA